MNGEDVEFADVVRYYLGDRYYYVAVVFSVLTLFGASIIYWVLMSGFLYNVVDYAHGMLQVYSDCLRCGCVCVCVYVCVHCLKPVSSTGCQCTASCAPSWTVRTVCCRFVLVAYDVVVCASLLFGASIIHWMPISGWFYNVVHGVVPFACGVVV